MTPRGSAIGSSCSRRRGWASIRPWSPSIRSTPINPTLAQLEAWTASAALAALTSRIEIIAAIKPLLYHPAVLAKMALQIEEISGGRFAINVVNAWNKLELERAGIPFPTHDARYAYGHEWLRVVEPLLRGESVHFQGDQFRLDGYALRPAGLHRARPRIYVGGESEPARALVADQGDVWFINGQPLADVQALIADVARRPRASQPLSFGLSAFVIARETDEEAPSRPAPPGGPGGEGRGTAGGAEGQHRSPVGDGQDDRAVSPRGQQRRHGSRPGRQLRLGRLTDRRLQSRRDRDLHVAVSAF